MHGRFSLVEEICVHQYLYTDKSLETGDKDHSNDIDCVDDDDKEMTCSLIFYGFIHNAKYCDIVFFGVIHRHNLQLHWKWKEHKDEQNYNTIQYFIDTPLVGLFSDNIRLKKI